MDAERMLRALADQSNEQAVILIGPDGNIAWWGHGAAHIFGYSKEDILGEPLARLFTAENAERGMPDYELETAARDGMAEDDIWMRRKDGSRFWAAGSVTPIRNEAGEVLAYGKILRDRTDQKEQIELLRNQVEALTSADEQKNVFLSTLSHELRNTLSPLMNAIELIRIMNPDSQQLRYPMRLIDRQLEFVRRLVDDLLDVTRISAGKVPMAEELIDLQHVLKDALESVDGAMKPRGHSVTVHVLPAPIPVRGDRDRLLQVFVNLLGNAAKFTPREGHIQLKAFIEATEAVVKVQDNGVGIAEHMQLSIFDLFTQAETGTPTRSETGLGIGLSLVKQFVALHHGSVQVRSEGLGKGSEFTVRLPLR